MSDPQPDNWQTWKLFWVELKHILVKPCYQPTFVFYFAIIIVAIGGISIEIALLRRIFGIDLFRNQNPLTSSMATYAFALLAGSTAEIVLRDKERRYFRMFSLTLGFIGVALAFSSQVASIGRQSLGWAVPAVIAAWLLWWIANAENANLQDSPPELTSATGGNPNSTPSGSLKGIKV